MEGCCHHSRTAAVKAPAAAESGYDPAMILATVDALLFSSKIRPTARLAGVEVTFALTP